MGSLMWAWEALLWCEILPNPYHVTLSCRRSGFMLFYDQWDDVYLCHNLGEFSCVPEDQPALCHSVPSVFWSMSRGEMSCLLTMNRTKQIYKLLSYFQPVLSTVLWTSEMAITCLMLMGQSWRELVPESAVVISIELLSVFQLLMWCLSFRLTVAAHTERSR